MRDASELKGGKVVPRDVYNFRARLVAGKAQYNVTRSAHMRIEKGHKEEANVDKKRAGEYQKRACLYHFPGKCHLLRDESLLYSGEVNPRQAASLIWKLRRRDRMEVYSEPDCRANGYPA